MCYSQKKLHKERTIKKIWEVAPYFSFVDFIVDRMIRHDISYRENDINSVLIDLEKYDLEYEVEESFFKVMYKDKGLKRGQIGELINLFSLFKYSLKNEMNWNEINLNYYCDYHFLCNEILKNTILMNCYYERIKEKFEYEGNTYEGKSIPYKSIDLTNDENRKIYEKFVNKIDGIKILDEMENVRNRIKKYFISICDYHAKEIFDNFKEIEDEVNYYCIDAPILYISYFICENMPEFKDWNYEVNSLIIFDKYEASDISNKRVFTHDISKNLKELSNIIKMLISEATCSIKNDKLEISFENLFEEERFEMIINEIANKYCESDVRKEDLLDIVRNNISVGLKKIYIIDSFNAGYIVNMHNSNNLEF